MNHLYSSHVYNNKKRKSLFNQSQDKRIQKSWDCIDLVLLLSLFSDHASSGSLRRIVMSCFSDSIIFALLLQSPPFVVTCQP
jgi:hypothetical protein